MKVKSRVTMILVILGVVMGMVVSGIGQDKPADNMQIVLEKVRADKKLLVSENMQLTEAEAKAFWPVYSPRRVSALRIGALETLISPPYGRSSSWVR
jgi:hypothetical protein